MTQRQFFHHKNYQIGEIRLGIGALWRDQTLFSISLSPDSSQALKNCSRSQPSEAFQFQQFPRQLETAFQQALQGRSLNWKWIASPPYGTPFQRKVWKALEEIEAGQVITYSQLAEKIGAPKAARAVGNACSQNPLPLRIPCHRVVAANGQLGGFTGDLRLKEYLLAREARAKPIQSSLHF